MFLGLCASLPVTSRYFCGALSCHFLFLLSPFGLTSDSCFSTSNFTPLNKGWQVLNRSKFDLGSLTHLAFYNICFYPLKKERAALFKSDMARMETHILEKTLKHKGTDLFGVIYIYILPVG